MEQRLVAGFEARGQLPSSVMDALSRVLHLVPPNGGGVDRFVRDLCAHRPADWILHVSDDQCVVECAQEGLFLPLAFTELGSLVNRGILGRAMALHAHSTGAAVRSTTVTLAGGMKLPYLVTLHDVEFAGVPASLGSPDSSARAEFIRGAARCTVPSLFLRRLAKDVLGDVFDCIVVENGADRQPTTAAGPVMQQCAIAVIGAVGQHKGLAHLVEIANALPAELRIALIGYADGQLGPGWLVDEKIWVHGAFEPSRLPQLVASYGAKIAFFPKGQPESFCYALSDAWLAGLPVVGPDCGAIGERVRAHGGGRLYPVQASAAEVALAITGELAQAAAGQAGVERAVQGLSSVAAMVGAMNAIYAAMAAPATAPDLVALQLAAKSHLDSRFFRKELLRLQGDLDAVAKQRGEALQELRTLADNFGKRGEWIDHLQRGEQESAQAIAALHQNVEALQIASAALGQDNERLRERSADHERLRAEHVQLQHLHDSLATRHRTLIDRISTPLHLLPRSWRPWVITMVKKILFVEGRNG